MSEVSLWSLQLDQFSAEYDGRYADVYRISVRASFLRVNYVVTIHRSEHGDVRCTSGVGRNTCPCDCRAEGFRLGIIPLYLPC